MSGESFKLKCEPYRKIHSEFSAPTYPNSYTHYLILDDNKPLSGFFNNDSIQYTIKYIYNP